MIKSLVVVGLNRKLDFDLSFNEDLNIFTGKNGSGKTTVLKLLWYLISGNLERILPDIQFEMVDIETDRYRLSIEMLRSSQSEEVVVKWKDTEHTEESTVGLREYADSKIVNELNHRIALLTKSSVFFPTFRRIEGGFSTHKYATSRVIRYRAQMGILQEAMADLSQDLSVFNHRQDLSVFNHRFVASISTHDIIELLTKQYADISEHTNTLQTRLSDYITHRIRDYSFRGNSSETKDLQDAVSILNNIQQQLDRVNQEREEYLRPFSVLSELINQIFRHRGIRVTEGITLGETKEAISSEKLSAGEKQMLSFLCYNAFTKDSAIFIDEPELSLHVDWQRLLFPTLLEQATGNQFIVATHSPFIYSKYPDKELILDEDRGGQ